MRRLLPVSFSLMALLSLVAMQAVPRLVAICQRPCGTDESCATTHAQASHDLSPEGESSCCKEHADDGSAGQTAGCQRQCPPGIEIIPPRCSDHAVPDPRQPREECRRNLAPCDACIPSQILSELPPDTLAKRLSPDQQRGFGIGEQVSPGTRGNIVRSHSPPALRLALSCSERCVALRVLLI